MGKRAQQASGHHTHTHTHSRTHLLTHTIRSVQLLFTLMCGSRLQYLIVFLSLLHSFASYSMSHLIAFENFEHFRSNRSNLSTFIHWETPVLYTAQFIQITWVFFNYDGNLQYEWEKRTYLIGNVFCFWCIFIWDIHFAQKIYFLSFAFKF